MRLLLVAHADKAFKSDQYGFELTNALRQSVDLHTAEFERMDGASARDAATVAGVELASVDAVLVWVRFRLRLEGVAFDWAGFDGARVWMEQDAWMNFDRSSPYYDAFPRVFRRDGFDLMISTGKNTCNRLEEEGVVATWIPKGFSGGTFFDLGNVERSGWCTFGTPWHSRRAMVHRVRRRGMSLTDCSGPFSEMNERLNQYSGALVCNKLGAPPFGKAGRAVARLWPEFVRLEPAVEPMIKTFEVAGAGCVPLVDRVEDLDDLGFVHGGNCLIYDRFDDAAELARATSRTEQIRLGKAAAALVHEHHTWRHRAQAIAAALE
jgi:hypothetical protein